MSAPVLWQELYTLSRGVIMPYPRRSKKSITYHGRKGIPIIHQAQSGRLYIMVRAKGGGVKRLYSGSKYQENGKVVRLDLKSM